MDIDKQALHDRWKMHAKLLLLAVGLVAAALLLWQMKHLVLLLFGAVLVAVLLRGFADLIRAYTPIGPKLSLALASLIILLIILGFAALLGTQIRAQMSQLFSQLPEAIDRIENWLGVNNLEEWVAQRAQSALEQASLVTQIFGYSSLVASALASTFLVIVAGLYLATNPRLYRNGLLMLFPDSGREEADDTLTAIGRALRLWLLGQLVAMVLVGSLVALGLWVLGIPSALALGFIAGVLEFVPFVGPIVAAFPGVVVALGENPTTALWVAGLYFAVQQLEGYFIMPLVQQETVDLPPAMTLFAIVAFGVLFGTVGVLLATPLTVVFFVIVKKLWVRDTLHEETILPGEHEEEG